MYSTFCIHVGFMSFEVTFAEFLTKGLSACLCFCMCLCVCLCFWRSEALFSFEMHLGKSDHKWTVLNTSINNHQDALWSNPLRPLPEVIRDTFNHISFIMQMHPAISLSKQNILAVLMTAQRCLKKMERSTDVCGKWNQMPNLYLGRSFSSKKTRRLLWQQGILSWLACALWHLSGDTDVITVCRAMWPSTGNEVGLMKSEHKWSAGHLGDAW